MADAGEVPVNRVANGGPKREMWQQLFGMLKLAIGVTLFTGIVALTVWRLLG